MSDDCTCTPNDVCYSCYARRRYGQDADRKVEGLPVGTPSSCSPPMTSERAEECSITAHCFVSDRHTEEPGCIHHEVPMKDGICSCCLADSEFSEWDGPDDNGDA